MPAAIIRIGIITLTAAALMVMVPMNVHAESSGTSEIMQEYNFTEMDKIMDSEMDTKLDFAEVVKDIIAGDGGVSSKNFVSQLQNTLIKELTSNRKALVQVILLAIISALFSNFANAFYNPQISETGYMVVSIAMFTILMAIFSVAVSITVSILDVMIEFFKALIPTYLTAVAFSSGSLTTAGFYEVLFAIILIINIVFKNVLITGCWIYVLLVMADSMLSEERLSKFAELIKLVITWSIKTIVVLITGINSIQGIVLPMADSVKSGLLTKSLKLIPGIGNGAAVISSTVIGAGTVVKNGIGAAAIIIIAVMAAIPVIKLVIFTLSYKFAAAVVQPVADKRIVKCINGAADGVRLLTTVAMSALIMLLVTIAIICVTTNVNFAQS